MIYLFAGDDFKKKLEVYENFSAKNSKDVEIFSISNTNFEENIFESLLGGAGLFNSKKIIFFSNILERAENKDVILNRLIQMSDSRDDFIFLEGKLNKSVLDVFKKARAEINYFELPKEKKEKFNNFLLADVFAERDKLKLWIYFRQAMDSGVSLEELVGVLSWKVKDMLLKKNFYKVKKEELQKIAFNLATILPASRKDGLDDESIFEKYLLEIF